MIMSGLPALAIYASLFVIIFTAVLTSLQHMPLCEDSPIGKCFLATAVTVLCLIRLWQPASKEELYVLCLPYEALAVVILITVIPAILGFIIGLTLRWYRSRFDALARVPQISRHTSDEIQNDDRRSNGTVRSEQVSRVERPEQIMKR